MKTLKLNHIALMLFGLIGSSAYGQMETGKVWVTVENEADAPREVGGRLFSSNPDIERLIEEHSILRFEQALPDSRNNDLLKVYEVECWCNWEELSHNMERTKGLLNPERGPEYELLYDPNDYNTVFTNDYALDLINAKMAWDYSTGDPSVILGVSDGNFFANHEELQNKAVYNDAPFSYITAYYYHGTAVAATVAGNTNNTLGKSSIGYDCKLALTTMNYNKLLNLSYMGARVINVSWTSGCWYSSYIQMLIDEMYLNGTIIVAAAGNGGTCGGPAALVYPAACNHVIAVSSVGPQNNHERTIGNPGTTHQHNSSVDICAPGYDVALTVAPGWYLTGNGTSFAAPYVTGTIGLMLAIRPCLTYEDVLNILQSTAFDLDALNPNYAGMLGAGRMDAGLALKMVSEMSCNVDDGNNGHGNDDGNFDPSNPGLGHGNNNGNNGQGGNGNGNGNNNGANNPNVINNDNATSGPGSNGNGRMNGETPERPGMDVVLYPNPTDYRSVIRWNDPRDVEISISNVNGKVIHREFVSGNQTQIEVSLEEKGVYFVYMTSGDEHLWTGKLIRM